MAAQELTQYIIEELQKGTFKFIIKNNLLHSGWKEEDINNAFIDLEAKPPPLIRNQLKPSSYVKPPPPPSIDRPLGKLVKDEEKTAYHAFEEKEKMEILPPLGSSERHFLKIIVILAISLLFFFIASEIIKKNNEVKQPERQRQECLLNCQRLIGVKPKAITDCENSCNKPQ